MLLVHVTPDCTTRHLLSPSSDTRRINLIMYRPVMRLTDVQRTDCESVAPQARQSSSQTLHSDSIIRLRQFLDNLFFVFFFKLETRRNQSMWRYSCWRHHTISVRRSKDYSAEPNVYRKSIVSENWWLWRNKYYAEVHSSKQFIIMHRGLATTFPTMNYFYLNSGLISYFTVISVDYCHKFIPPPQKKKKKPTKIQQKQNNNW